MEVMTAEERRSFLLTGHRTAKLATVRADGRPHIAPIWYDLDGEDMIFTTWETTVKGRNMREHPQVSLCVDDDAPPFAFVIIEGIARIDPAAQDLLYWATRIATRYMGAVLGEQYGKRNAVPGETLVRVTPTRIIAQKGISD